MNKKVSKVLEYGESLIKGIKVNSYSFNKELLKKKSYNTKILCDFSSLDNIECNYPVKIENNKVCFTYNPDVLDQTQRRNHPSINISFDNIDLSLYNQFCLKMKMEATGFVNFYVHYTFINNGKEITHTHSVIPNTTNDIVWEISKEKLTNVSKFNILIFVMGTPPEGLNEVKVTLEELVCRDVIPYYDEGWKLENRVAYSHIGYMKDKIKRALVSKDIVLRKAKLVNRNNEEVYNLLVADLGDFYELDFSPFDDLGYYKISLNDGKIESDYFEIGENIYTESIKKSLNFFKSLRCGENVAGVHSPCHLLSKTYHPVTKAYVSNCGGWHDAGDLSQFEICTAEMTASLCDLALALKEGLLYDQVLEEAYVGSNWLLKTRFNDGYRANTVLYRTWHHNVIDNDAHLPYSEAEEGPFENFLSSIALSKMSKVSSDKSYSDWCLRVAIEDFNFGIYEYDNGIYTKRWGKSIDSQVCGALLEAGALLYEITEDEYYLNMCAKYYRKVLDTQEVNTNLQIYGFFYEDKEHNYILAYEHRGHDQSPICGIVSYYNVCKDEKIKNELLYSMNLYSYFIKKSMNECVNKYKLLPAGVYNPYKINLNHYTLYGYTNEAALKVLQDQVYKGKRYNKEYYLRSFPISVSRRGFHATLLSKTKGVSYLAKMLNDKQLQQIAIHQIEWVLGYNPFSASSMYGLGHNYHPLYVAFSKQMIGALPVGFMTYKDNDAPYWPVRNNAVYKEIWGHTSGKFLWVLADLIEMENKNDK